jgi:two-component system cell cycle sensor histidine kinase/response regulator CckA
MLGPAQVSFPLFDHPTTSPSPLGKGQNRVGGSETILVIDDQDRIRTVTRMLLEAHGYQVLEADGGESAMRVIEAMTSPLHLVLTDIVMPGLTGPQVAELLLARYPSLPILFMSGFTDDVVIRQGIQASSANFLQKPFTASTLAKKVREALDAR